MDISIIVPVYNAAEYLNDCLNSFLNQTKKEIEVVLVDDGSKDNSLEICKEFSKKDSRVKVISQENGGPSSARNTALDSVIGQWILFVDSDDAIATDMCEKMYNAAMKTNADMVLCNMVNIFPSGKRETCRPFYENRVFEDEELHLYEKMMIQRKTETGEDTTVMTGPVCKLIRRDIIKEHRFPFELRLAEDVCFLASIFSNIKKVVYINEDLYYRYVRENSLTFSVDNKMSEKMVGYTNWMTRFHKNNAQMRESIELLQGKNLCDVIVNYLMVVDISVAEAVVKIKDYMKKTDFSLSLGKILSMKISLKDKLILSLAKINCFWAIKLMCNLKKNI